MKSLRTKKDQDEFYESCESIPAAGMAIFGIGVFIIIVISTIESITSWNNLTTWK